MFLRFQKIALDVSYGFRQYSPLFLIEVFLIKKRVNLIQMNSELWEIKGGNDQVSNILLFVLGFAITGRVEFF